MQSVKQHENLRKFPNAASITSGEGLDKKISIPVITNEGDVRQKNTNNVQ